eukprot:scaffold86391_cov21-Tisochrysis_lutea.AAC.4
MRWHGLAVGWPDCRGGTAKPWEGIPMGKEGCLLHAYVAGSHCGLQVHDMAEIDFFPKHSAFANECASLQMYGP